MTPHKRLHTPAVVPPVDDTEDERLLRVHRRPDGYHWVDIEGRQEFGPFVSLEDALADMDDVEVAFEGAIEQTDLDEAGSGLDFDGHVDRRDEDDLDGPT